MIDIRCDAIDLSVDRHGAKDAARCQLAVGHEGDHALMFCQAGERTVRIWSGRGAVSQHRAGQEVLPWVRGMPTPAWFATGAPSPDWLTA
jgi:hypothetical protein